MIYIRKNLFIALAISLLPTLAIAQISNIVLQPTQDVSKEIIATKPVTDTSICKNIPFKNYRYWSLRRVSYNNIQRIYESVIDKTLSLDDYLKFVRNYKTDTTYVYKAKIPKNYIYLCTGIDSTGIKHIVVDANNDRDFKNDKELKFDLIKKDTSTIILNVKVDYFDGSTIKEAIVPMKLDAYNTIFSDESYPTINDKNLDLIFFKLLPIMAGKFIIKNDLYDLQISNLNPFFKKSSFTIDVAKFDKVTNQRYTYSNLSTDTIDFGYDRFKVVSLDSNNLKLKFIGKNLNGGAQIGTVAPQFTSKDIISGKQFSLNQHHGKYVLVDFWGSWCIPCIRLIPELRAIHESYGKTLQFVSIAYDKVGNKEKLRKLIEKHDLNWPQIFDDQESLTGQITESYKVQEFPTSILIDPNGKIIYRSVGEGGLKKLVEYFTLKSSKEVRK
jgi:thiol-disulfide isomerase/thioredoxin